MISADRSCKGCREEYRVTEEQIQRVLASGMFNADNTAPPQIYEERLRQCYECPRLLDGNTCSLCGCVVRITAKLKDKSCPLSGIPRWQKYAE